LAMVLFSGPNRSLRAAQESPTVSADAAIPELSPLRFDSIQMLNADDGWATAFLAVSHPSDVADTNLVLRTQDGGKTWQDATPSAFNSGGSADFLDASHAWYAYLSGADYATGDFSHTVSHIWRTTNGGRSWAETVLNVPHMNGHMLEFIDPAHGWLLLLRCCA